MTKKEKSKIKKINVEYNVNGRKELYDSIIEDINNGLNFSNKFDKEEFKNLCNNKFGKIIEYHYININDYVCYVIFRYNDLLKKIIISEIRLKAVIDEEKFEFIED